MLSQKARYALKALFMLAARTTGETVMIAEIAAEAGVPRKFLEQILLELKKRGIVHSHRGKHGGYALGRSPDKISFAEVIRVIDGPLALSPCASVTAYRRCDDCFDEATCTLAQSAARSARRDRGHSGEPHAYGGADAARGEKAEAQGIGRERTGHHTRHRSVSLSARLLSFPACGRRRGTYPLRRNSADPISCPAGLRL